MKQKQNLFQWHICCSSKVSHIYSNILFSNFWTIFRLIQMWMFHFFPKKLGAIDDLPTATASNRNEMHAIIKFYVIMFIHFHFQLVVITCFNGISHWNTCANVQMYCFLIVSFYQCQFGWNVYLSEPFIVFDLLPFAENQNSHSNYLI